MSELEWRPLKKTIGFDRLIIRSIENWRIKQKPIPNVSEAIRRKNGRSESVV